MVAEFTVALSIGCTKSNVFFVELGIDFDKY